MVILILTERALNVFQAIMFRSILAYASSSQSSILMGLGLALCLFACDMGRMLSFMMQIHLGFVLCEFMQFCRLSQLDHRIILQCVPEDMLAGCRQTGWIIKKKNWRIWSYSLLLLLNWSAVYVGDVVGLLLIH